MAFKYLENRELEKALSEYITILSNTITLSEEEVPVTEGLNRVTSRAVYGALSSPHYLASAMDGIAVRAGDTFGATETTPVQLEEDRDFVMIDTGDPVPDEYDSVIMIEDVIIQDEKKVKIITPAYPYQHIRQIGEDICAGEMLLRSGTPLRPQEIGALLAGGIGKVMVYKKPLIAILPTGDEIIKPVPNPEKGQILEFNSALFSTQITTWGGLAKVYDITPDDYSLLKQRVLQAAHECDIVLVNAGSSAGRDDYTKEIIAELGTVFCHGLAIKPGKPTILGIIENKPVIGIPGYPVSGIIVMEKIVKHLVSLFTGHKVSETPAVTAHLARKVVSSLKYQEFKRVRLGRIRNKLTAIPITSGAGVITSYVRADGILTISQNCEGYERGSSVKVELLRSLDEIEKTIVIAGSHDPLIDEINDLIGIKNPLYSLGSSHIGSINGIMAVKAGESHGAGIHLLNEADGTYNTSFLNKHLNPEEIVHVKGVKRTQGILCAPDNPLNIKSITDLTRQGIRYVNRQKGSGTRLLFDYLLRQQGLSGQNIYGYSREEFTHMSVAAQIARNTGDAGLAIYGAAKIYGLHFIPVWEEEYDFVLTRDFFNSPAGELFISALRSDELKKRLEKLGGYKTDMLGKL